MMSIRPVIAELEKRFGDAVSYCGEPGAQEPAPGGEAAVPAHLSRTDHVVLVGAGRIRAVCEFLASYRQCPFNYLITLTAVDFPGRNEMEVLYFLYSTEKNLRLCLKCILQRENPKIESVTPVWKAAEFPEREVFDLFGVTFTGHPDLRRIFLEEDFSGHPLRKDWDADFFLRKPEVAFR